MYALAHILIYNFILTSSVLCKHTNGERASVALIRYWLTL